MEQDGRERIRLTITGRVQGVGFRPAVYRHARRAGVSGWVSNTFAGVAIEAEGVASAVRRFREDICRLPPPQARIEACQTELLAPRGGEDGFRILASSRSGDIVAGMPPDLATCAECLDDVIAPGGRRQGYPFTNCTACGPRFTIVRELPYDRERTTMARQR